MELSDKLFLRSTARLLTYSGLFLSIIHGVGAWWKIPFCAHFLIPLWAGEPYAETSFFMFNIAFCMSLIGLGISLYNPLAWWMLHFLSITLLCFFMVFSFVGISTFYDGWGAADKPITHEVAQSLILNLALFLLNIIWVAYLCTASVRRIFGVLK